MHFYLNINSALLLALDVPKNGLRNGLMMTL